MVRVKSWVVYSQISVCYNFSREPQRSIAETAAETRQIYVLFPSVRMK